MLSHRPLRGSRKRTQSSGGGVHLDLDVRGGGHWSALTPGPFPGAWLPAPTWAGDEPAHESYELKAYSRDNFTVFHPNYNYYCEIHLVFNSGISS